MGLVSIPFGVSAASFTSPIQTGEFKDYQILTQHFQIEFDYIILVQTDTDGDGIPDVVEEVADYAEHSWAMEVDYLGFDGPIDSSWAVPYVTIVLDDEYEYLWEGTTGVTSVLTDETPFFAVDPWLSERVMRVTIAHEFMHCIQFGYDPYFLESDQDLNFAEASAVWTEDYVYPGVDDYLGYLSDFFNYPDYSIFAGTVPEGTLFEYALAVWPMFLTQYYDYDGLMVDLWETFFDMDYMGDAGVFTVYTSVVDVLTREGDDLSDVYVDFSIWNLAHDQTYLDGAYYPDVYIMREWNNSSVVGQMPVMGMRPALYGTNYIGFRTSYGHDFEFTVTKSEDIEMAVTFVPMNTLGVFDLDAVEKNILYIGDTYGEFVFKNADEYYKIYVLVSPVDVQSASGLMTFDIGYPYYYSAGFGDFDEADVEVGGEVGVEVEAEEKEGVDATTSHEEGVREQDDLNLSISYYDGDSITLKWNRISSLDIDYYVVYFENADGQAIGDDFVEHAWSTVYTVKELAPESKYYFVVEAYDANDGFLISSEEIAGVTSAFSFEDMNSSDEEYEAVMGLHALGIIQGYADGNFYPDQTVNRAELLKILVEGQGITPDEEIYQGCFDDVADDWYAKYVCYAKEQGWVQGYADGNFYPAQTVNKVEALKMLLIVYGHEVSEEDDVHGGMPYSDTWATAWYAGYVKTAFDLGILTEADGGEFDPEGGRDRGDICMELWELVSSLIDSGTGEQ